MQLITLKTEVRETGRKAFSARTRAAGDVPAVLYGENQGTVSIAVNRADLEKMLHAEGGTHAVVQLECENAPEHNSPALLKDIQRHPVRDHLLHVDFLRIRLDRRIETQVAVVLVGRSKGVVEGGVIDQQLREVDVECLALDTPNHFEVDISHLEMGDSVHVSDLVIPDNVTLLTDTEYAIASVHAPRVVKTAEEEAAEAAEAAEEAEEAEPELVDEE